MKAAIDKIKVMKRIRKEITGLLELSADMKTNGLIQPIVVMSLDGGEFQLLAGLRRIRAAQSLGWTEIEVFVASPADAEAALRLEYSENEVRVDFTYSEKMDYAQLIEEIERAKAAKRKTDGQILGGTVSGRGRHKDDCFEGHGPQSNQGKNARKAQTREIVGAKIGMSGRTYERAKYIADNAPSEVIEQIDKGKRSIRSVYDDLRVNEKSDTIPVQDGPGQAESVAESALQSKATYKRNAGSSVSPTPIPSDSATEEMQMRCLSAKDREGVRKLQEYNSLPPEGKIIELQRQLKEQRARAATAESELAMLRESHGIDVDHKDSIIESLKRQNIELSDALESANRRIAELEAKV